jgi:hypothetical protein
MTRKPEANVEYAIHLRKPHAKQREFIEHPAKRKIIRAGRRGGKTTGIGIFAARMFLQKRRVLYATPTAEQIGKFWFEVTRAFMDPIADGALYKNETEHVIELPGTETRIRAKTAWNADTLRGDYADVLIFDEWQLMNEDAWGVVGVPMLLDNNGDAVFIYTPPSIRNRSTTKATDAMHAAKLFKTAQVDVTGRWAAFHFTSHDNPYISTEALQEIQQDMTSMAYRQEILAEDIEDNPGALWKRVWLDDGRLTQAPELRRVVVAVDPSATSTGDEAGIIGAGVAYVGADPHLYVLEDASLQGSPDAWARAAVTLYHKLKADCIVAESNNGGEMVESVIRAVDRGVKVKLVHASRGKQTRAEPVSALYEQGRGHHVGTFPALEDELCQWEQGAASPNRLDALVWAGTELVRARGVFVG